MDQVVSDSNDSVSKPVIYQKAKMSDYTTVAQYNCTARESLKTNVILHLSGLVQVNVRQTVVSLFSLCVCGGFFFLNCCNCNPMRNFHCGFDL